MKNFDKPKKESTLPKGQLSEDLAVEFLKSKRFRIVERNVKFKVAELDIVAMEGQILVFVEVRSRATDRFGSPKASVGPNKQWHILKAAQAYLQKKYHKMPICRFDVVSVIGYDENAQIEHIRDAFRMPIEPTVRRRGPWQPF